MAKHLVAVALAVLGMAALGGSPALAQNDNPELCSLIGPATQRLQCYDNIFRPDGLTGADSSSSGGAQGLWTSGVEVSQIEGTELPFATVQSQQLIPALEGGRAPARLTILCVADETVLEFGFAGSEMGTPTSQSATLTLQFDRQPPRSQSVDLSADRLTIGFFDTEDARAVIDQLLRTERLYVRATPQSQRSVTVSFLMNGLEAALEPVRTACDW